jgi:hypothetical protein
MKLILLMLTLAATAVLTACGGDGGTGTATPSPRPSTAETVSASPTTSVEEAVTAGYLQYWHVYSDALYNLDGSRLSDVMTGPRLQRAINEVSALLQQGRAVKIEVSNQPVVLQINGDRATVFDEYQNRSGFIDPATKEPLSSPGAAEVIRDSVTLTQIDGVWKVLDSVRETG